MTKWSPQQDSALKTVDDWFKSGTKDQQTFRLFGCAGTGKTTLAKHIAENIDGTVKFATFTGKAAHVMASKGCVGAGTIHRLIYRPKAASKAHLRELEKQLEEYERAPEPDWDTIDSIRAEIKLEQQNAGRMSFSKNMESELRYAKLLILDECFVKGTLINTPKGLRCIEDIAPGDKILNAHGVDTVTRISRKEAKSGIKIVCGGKEITCSENHRFFTERGEVCARDLRLGERLTELSQSMRLLQDGIQSNIRNSEILHCPLQHALVAAIPRIQAENIYGRSRTKLWSRQKSILSFWFRKSTTTNSKNTRIKSFSESRNCHQDKQNSQETWTHVQGTWWKWKRPNRSTVSVIQYLGTKLANGICSILYQEDGKLSYQLQTGYSEFQKENCYRSGWQNSQAKYSKTSRFKKDAISRESRVESITFLELGHSELDRFRNADGKLYLYDLTAERHSSFAVEGILVHNCSMVDATMGADLESFGVPILALGDPEQLPPIYGQGYFTERKPDIMLTEIHRQALDNPIIQMAQMVREGKPLALGNYGSSRVVDKQLESEDVLRHNIILTGLRKTKKACDDRCRTLLEKTGKLPVAGDRLMCVKNNHNLGILNGQMWTAVSDAVPMGGGTVSLHIQDENGIEMAVSACEKLFYGQPLQRWEHEEDIEEFEYSYAITVHKAQGSQWDHVLLFDQKDKFPMWNERDRRRWLYTGITRAAESVTVMRL